MRGKVLGSWLSGTAHVVTGANTLEVAYREPRAKYGWQIKVGDFFSKLSGRYGRRAMLEISLGQ